MHNCFLNPTQLWSVQYVTIVDKQMSGLTRVGHRYQIYDYICPGMYVCMCIYM